MLNSPIYITSFGSISPLGLNSKEVWNSYLNEQSFITTHPFLASRLSHKSNQKLDELTPKTQKVFGENKQNNKYKTLDRSVLMAIYASQQAFDMSGWKQSEPIGINIGSSRGATQLTEKYLTDFLTHKKLSPLSSPTTTLGNLSSWVAQHLQVQGPVISHSITCSTALHSVLNAIAWINSGMTSKFIAGGTEAANTPFTVAQMQSLKIYSDLTGNKYPCESLNFEKKKNTMVLGEGAAAFCLENKNNPLGLAIKSVGYATEQIKHNASISEFALCFQSSMKQASDGFNLNEIDVIVMHAPGTIKGDLSELNAIKQVFGNKLPALTSNKWKIGHTLGASGALSLEMALLMLQHQQIIESPFYHNTHLPTNIKNILVNAVGFGGNAVSLVVGI